MIKYVGPISSCILILKILLVYVYKLKDILETLNVGVNFFFYFVIKMGKYTARLLQSSVVNITA